MANSINGGSDDASQERKVTFLKMIYSKDIEGLDWLIQAIKRPETVSWTDQMKVRLQDATELLHKVVNGPREEGEKAFLILAKMQESRTSTLCRILNKSRATINRYWKMFNKMGTASLARGHTGPSPKAEDETIKAAVFSVIHSPPSEHNINRTSSKLADICSCLSQQ